MYINNITANIHSELWLFVQVDDILIYRPIGSERDQKILQDDLKAFMKWADMWQMDFNISKCSILQVTTLHTTKTLIDEWNTSEIGGAGTPNKWNTSEIGGEGQLPWNIPKQ